jgi:hypothetical protein
MFTKSPIGIPIIAAMRSKETAAQAAHISARSFFVVLLVCVMAGCSPKETKKEDTQTKENGAKAEKPVDYCALAGKDDLATLYRKPLYPTATDNGCMWSEEPGGMADLSMSVLDYQRKLRTYFTTDLPDNVKLVEITDLGDSGLMTVVDGTLGVIVVRKGNHVLQSAATFLDIKPGSEAQKVLWQIYGRALGR